MKIYERFCSKGQDVTNLDISKGFCGQKVECFFPVGRVWTSGIKERASVFLGRAPTLEIF